MFNNSAPPIVNGNDWFVTKPALEMSRNWQFGILVIMVVLAAVAFAYAAVVARRTGRSYPYFICIGAAVASFYEPLGDLLSHVTYHEVNQINFTASFGFRTPLWVLPCYVIFFGLPVLTLGNQIDKGISHSKWMVLFFILVASAWLFEVPIINSGATSYYGANQPFKILNYPVWMAFSNTCTMFVVAVSAHFLKDTPIARKWPVVLVPLMPMLVIAGSAASALPLASAINSSLNPVTVNIMAFASMALATFYVWVAGSLVCSKVHALTGITAFTPGVGSTATSR